MLLGALDNPVSERREIFRLADWIRRSRLTGIITCKTEGVEQMPRASTTSISPTWPTVWSRSSNSRRHRCWCAGCASSSAGAPLIRPATSRSRSREPGCRRRPIRARTSTVAGVERPHLQRRRAARHHARRRVLPRLVDPDLGIAGHREIDAGSYVRRARGPPRRPDPVRHLRRAPRRGRPQHGLGRHRPRPFRAFGHADRSPATGAKSAAPRSTSPGSRRRSGRSEASVPDRGSGLGAAERWRARPSARKRSPS